MGYQKIADWKRRPELQGLLDLPNPPKEFYYQGQWNKEIFADCATVVGSRKMTDYGRRVIEKLVPQLVLEKKTIVSGFMYGVDQYAHKTALESGGKTVAVLGWGIAVPAPGTDDVLAKKIVESGGLILSEWIDQKGTNWTFPMRDRLLAALAKEIYIVEAAERSGALITTRIAAKLGRKIFAAPGPITSRTSAGTNNLIATGVASAWLGQSQQEKMDFSDPILQTLADEAQTADELSRKLARPVAEVGAKLTLLLLSGQVTQSGDKYFLNDAN